MVSIVLGLLVTAAAIQLFTGGLITSRIHQANSELQDSGIFGLDYIARDIRMANQGNLTNPALNDQTPWGGIILTANTATTNNGNLPIPAAAPFISQGLLSHSVGNGESVSTTINEWRGVSNVKIGSNQAVSDQLTIQFIAPNAMTNCEGETVQGNDLIVQRYFMRPDPPSSTTSTSYVLACDANTPTPIGTTPTSTPNNLSGFGGAGQAIIPGIEYLKFLLGARDSAGNLTYYTINQYRAAAIEARRTAPITGTSPQPAKAATIPPRIILVKIGILVRSANDTQNPSIDLTKTFNILGDTVKPTDTTNRYVRQVYVNTIALRNGLGEVL
ncbi:MAG: pilus assembly protein PilW [Pedobacter sp.]|nr:MAG: pilus assembly protein PilW [Pedobacter sp.]